MPATSPPRLRGARCGFRCRNSILNHAQTVGSKVLARDKLVFLGQLTTAGGLELLRSVLQEFTRWKRRLHVTLAGCVGRTAYGNPFQVVAETLSDLKHDFAFVLSNDPIVLLDALDGTALTIIAERLALRKPMMDLLAAHALPVLDLTPTDWIESWQADTSASLSQRYVVGRAAAARLHEALDAGTAPPPPPPPDSLSVADLLAEIAVRPRSLVGGARSCGFLFCKDAPGRFLASLPKTEMPIDGLVLSRSGEGFQLTLRIGQPTLLMGKSVADVLGVLLAASDHDAIAVCAETAMPVKALYRWLPALATEAQRHGVVIGDHQSGRPVSGSANWYQVPPRHLLQPLWHPGWRAPLVLYGRTHLAELASDPDARTHAFSPFALWALSAASETQARTVPLVLSQHVHQPTLPRPWAQLGTLRQELDHVVALADSKGILTRDLAVFIHGVHGTGKLRDVTNAAPLMVASARDLIGRLQALGELTGPLWAVRMTHLLADLDRPDAALVLLDKIRLAAKGAEFGMRPPASA